MTEYQAEKNNHQQLGEETGDHKIIHRNMQTNKGITRLLAKLKLL